jgi:putative transcriptional regulator
VITVSVYNSIINGLNEAIEYEKGEVKNITVNRVRIASLPHFHGSEIKAIREKHRLSQQVFAEALGVSKKTVEAWEADRNVPEGPAQRMLELIDKDENLFEKYAILNRE